MTESWKLIAPFWPFRSLNNLIRVLCQDFVFMEIQDFIAWKDVAVQLTTVDVKELLFEVIIGWDVIAKNKEIEILIENNTIIANQF